MPAAEIKYMHAHGLDATLFLWFQENSSLYIEASLEVSTSSAKQIFHTILWIDSI
jgi:hypothetical protein